MKSKDIMWIGLALAAGYLLAQHQQRSGTELLPRSTSGKNQSPAIYPGKGYGHSAIAGHRCACTRQVTRRHTVV